jgi:hypothetical protein
MTWSMLLLELDNSNAAAAGLHGHWQIDESS